MSNGYAVGSLDPADNVWPEPWASVGLHLAPRCVQDMTPVTTKPVCALATLRLMQSAGMDRMLPNFLGLQADEVGAKACGRLAILTRDQEALRDAELEHYNCNAIDWHLIEVEGPEADEVPWACLGDIVIDDEGHGGDLGDYRELFRINTGYV